jgi:hypothetical protein
MLIFYCPVGQKPNGGHKVIYKTVESLNNYGVKSYIFHEIQNYKLKWFKYTSEVKFTNKITSSSHIVIPEVSLLNINKNIFFNSYSILVQNGYLIFNDCEGKKSYKKLKNLYSKAKNIYCVSPDTAQCVIEQFPNIKKKIINFIPNIDLSIFKANQNDYHLKKNLITIMTRKNLDLASNIIKHLVYRLPKNWKIQIIDNLNEKEVAKILKSSKIFINVPGPEGFPAPPIEAALSGNIVVGSTGNGAKAYWYLFKFQPVELGDVRKICENILSAIKKNKFNNKTSSQKNLIKFLNNNPKLHQVIQKNHHILSKNISNDNKIVYQAKSYLIVKLFAIMKKLF